MELEKNLLTVKSKIREVCSRVDRDPDEIKIIAVSKTFPFSRIIELNTTGHEDFGENRIRELRDKYSVDSFKLAEEIDNNAKKIKRTIEILIQVNTSNEPQKYGIHISEAASLCKQISLLENVRVKGLMTMAKLTDDQEVIRSSFRSLKKLYDELKPDMNDFEFLSMGMSNDYEIAIEEGANMIRIGSAIFGERPVLV